jgi:deferrochelatase/peroxidase EfeB
MADLSRRAFLSAVGLAGGGAALSACRPTATTNRLVSPYGAHQAGILTPQQQSLAFAAFDLTSSSRADLVSLLATWSAAIGRMTAGKTVADDEGNPESPPQDTGEALGLSAGNLTVTVGFGPTLFDERFGLAPRRPAALADLPRLPGDFLEEGRSGGDLCVQACADDPQVAFHAMRNLRRLAEGTAMLRWTQLGFGKTSSTSESQATPRNLMGFKDGTNNLKSEQTSEVDGHIWVGAETDQPWMRGGSYLVARRIQMLLESWDRDRLSDQEAVIGRRKDTGAPLTGHREHDPLDLEARNADGSPVLAVTAHVRLANPASNGGAKMLRRGYSFTDGTRPDTGQLDAGLFFIAFQKDPRHQFVPVQRNLGTHDALNEYIRHTGSAVFACPPGMAPGESLGAALFA